MLSCLFSVVGHLLNLLLLCIMHSPLIHFKRHWAAPPVDSETPVNSFAVVTTIRIVQSCAGGPPSLSVLQSADWAAENITSPSPWASGALKPKES